jgi:phosphoglycolate phosphatase-like HAD superfamily hydrolase
MLRGIKAIGWDVDGTLRRQWDIAISGFADAFAWFLGTKGASASPQEILRFTPQIKSLPRRDLFDFVCQQYKLRGLTKADFGAFNAEYQKKTKKALVSSPMLREAKAAIVFFGERKYKQFIVSSGPKPEIVLWFLRQTGCRPYIQAIYAQTGTAAMPKSEAIQDFCRKNGLPARAVAFVGDSSADIVAARKAGAKAILLSKGRERVAVMRPHRRISSISQLNRVIQMRPRARRPR